MGQFFFNTKIMLGIIFACLGNFFYIQAASEPPAFDDVFMTNNKHSAILMTLRFAPPLDVAKNPVIFQDQFFAEDARNANDEILTLLEEDQNPLHAPSRSRRLVPAEHTAFNGFQEPGPVLARRNRSVSGSSDSFSSDRTNPGLRADLNFAFQYGQGAVQDMNSYQSNNQLGIIDRIKNFLGCSDC